MGRLGQRGRGWFSVLFTAQSVVERERGGDRDRGQLNLARDL